MSVHLIFFMIIILSNDYFISSLILSQILQILRQKKYVCDSSSSSSFVQVITRFISCANFFANSQSERGFYAIFGFEAFFSARQTTTSTAGI
jgi:hypothetical protein